VRKDETQSRRFAKQMRGAMSRFRRQHPIGPYIADFACVAAKLVVEVDRLAHWTAEQLAHDAKRTRFLESKGWRVLRVSSGDVYGNLDGG
jgi:very-short-patch-repair endonuclease